jgi:hypothetical protein
MALLLGLVLFLLGTLAPGFALAWAALPDGEPVEVATTGAVVGLFGLPVLHFGVAWLLGRSIDGPLILGVSAAVVGLAVAVQAARSRRSTGTS